MEELRYPIGRFKKPGEFDADLLKQFKKEISELPADLIKVTEGMDDLMLDTPYRPEGWTARQVIHHLADSHINSYIRYRWTLTEKQPLIKAYNEKDWSQLEDAKHAPIELSINILSAIHKKWAYFLDTLSQADLERSFIHPEKNVSIDLFTLTALYAWHGKHHIGHINLVVNK